MKIVRCLSLAFLFLALPLLVPAQSFTKIGNATTATYVDSTCPDSATCYYEITSLDSQGHESTPSNIATAQIPSTATHTITLKWTPPAIGTTPTSYNVYQEIGPAPPTGLTATVQ